MALPHPAIVIGIGVLSGILTGISTGITTSIVILETERLNDMTKGK